MSNNSALDEMLGILMGTLVPPESSHHPDPSSVEEIIDEIRNIEPVREPPKRVTKRANLVDEVPEFDPKSNMLDPDNRRAFEQDTLKVDEELFTRPTSTTNTLKGFISNVSFHEQELITKLTPNVDVVMLKCNYGKLIYSGYTVPIKERKSNRGRKKKVKNKKPRKKQGTGDEMNSQITFVVRSRRAEVGADGTVPPSSRVYKFKVFRTGELQLPGVLQSDIHDVIECAHIIVDMLNSALHPKEIDITKRSRLVNLNPVMKNYKFVTKLQPGMILDQKLMCNILCAYINPTVWTKLAATENTSGYECPVADTTRPSRPPGPAIFTCKYSRQESKLSIRFHTPIANKTTKLTRVNIFMEGKVNILGALNLDDTQKICDFLAWFLKTFPNVIVRQYSAPTVPKLQTPPIELTEEDIQYLRTEYPELANLL